MKENDGSIVIDDSEIEEGFFNNDGSVKDDAELGFESSVLQSILEGKKTVEGRLAKGKFLNFKVGDKILLREDIWKNGEIIDSGKTNKTVDILAIKKYRSFEDMLGSEGFENVIPSAQSIEEALLMYRQFYSAEDEEKIGVIAFKIALQ